jgi:hypothetical protein
MFTKFTDVHAEDGCVIIVNMVNFTPNGGALGKDAHLMDDSILCAISDAAAACLSIHQIANEIGISSEDWQALLVRHRDEIALAIARGRAEALLKNGEDLALCAKLGNADATLFILQHYFGWPKPKVGRPRKLVVPVSLQRR